MNIRKFVRDLNAVKKERGRSKERFTWRQGTVTLCESKEHYEYLDAFTTALTSGEIKPEEFSIRELFEECVPDGRELARSFDPRRGGDNTMLIEAAGGVAASDFSNITGQIVYTKLIEKMALEDYVFTKLIPTQSTPFDGERIAGIGGIGDEAESVGEGEQFPLVGVSEDWIDTPQTTKRGMIIPITKEAIFFDRTNQLLTEAGKIGEWLAVNKEKRAIDCVIDENVTTHRHKWRGTTYGTYQTSTPWINDTSTGYELVDWTDIDAIEQLYNAITDPSTGEPVAIEPTHLIVTKEYEMVARRILSATQIVTHVGGYATTGNLSETQWPNPYQAKYQLVSTRLLASRAADDDDWYLGNPTKAFVYMENWPIAVIRQDEGHDMFHRDIVTQFRASERGQYYVLEPRAMAKAQNA